MKYQETYGLSVTTEQFSQFCVEFETTDRSVQHEKDDSFREPFHRKFEHWFNQL